jgi:hypothetical protein
MSTRIRILALLPPLLALVSCSSGLRLKVVPAEDVTARDVASARRRAPARYVTRDTLRESSDGLVVVRGDSLFRLRRVSVGRTLERAGPPEFRLDGIERSLTLTGYVSADGDRHEWAGQVRARGDSFQFVRPAARAHGLRKGAPGDTLWLARHQVTRLDVEDMSPTGIALGATLGLGLLVTLAFVGFVYSGIGLGRL